MVDPYMSTPPAYRPYIRRAQTARAEFARALVSRTARAVVSLVRRLGRKLWCVHARNRAEAELMVLSDGTLRDIGVTRGEIPSLVHGMLAAECGGCGDESRRRVRLAA